MFVPSAGGKTGIQSFGSKYPGVHRGYGFRCGQPIRCTNGPPRGSTDLNVRRRSKRLDFSLFFDARAPRAASSRVVEPFDARLDSRGEAPLGGLDDAHPHVLAAHSREGARVRAVRPPHARRAGGVRERALLERLLGTDADLDGLVRLLAERELAEIARFEPRRLEEDARLAPCAARVLAAAFALGRAVERSVGRERARLDAPSRVHALLAPRVRGRPQEHVFALLLDARHTLRRARLVGLGTLTSSLVHPREVFGPAVREAAAGVIVAHNHPSGDPTPSAEDVEVTRRLLATGDLLGIPLVDHVVLTDTTWTSLRERFPELPFGARGQAVPWSASQRAPLREQPSEPER